MLKDSVDHKAMPPAVTRITRYSIVNQVAIPVCSIVVVAVLMLWSLVWVAAATMAVVIHVIWTIWRIESIKRRVRRTPNAAVCWECGAVLAPEKDGGVCARCQSRYDVDENSKRWHLYLTRVDPVGQRRYEEKAVAISDEPSSTT